MEAFLGTILPWAPNFSPRGWMPCDGRLLPINQYSAVFALLGTTYGGDGVRTFALPDLRGRLPIGISHNISQGEITHGNDPVPPASVVVAQAGADGKLPPAVTINTPSVPPTLGVNFIICIEGIFPSRD